MKKNKILIVFLGLFLMISVVYAEERNAFIKDWSTNNYYNNPYITWGNSDKPYFRYDDKTYYKYGYFIVEGNKIIKYDIKGNKIKEKEFEIYDELYFLEEHNDYLYLILMNRENLNSSKVIVLNLDMEVLNEYVNNGFNIGNVDMEVSIKLFGLEHFYIDDDGTGYFLSVNPSTAIYAFGGEYSEVTKLGAGEYGADIYYSFPEIYNKIFPNFVKMQRMLDAYSRSYVSYDEKGDYVVYAGVEDLNNCAIDSWYTPYNPAINPGGRGTSCDRGTEKKPVGSLKLMKDDKDVWTKQFDNYVGLFNAKLVNNYIVVVGQISDAKFELLILDLEGNVIQVFNDADIYGNIEGRDTSFIVTVGNKVDNGMCTGTGDECYELSNQVWYIPFNISSKVEGKGKINISDAARYGEKVSYEIKETDGYRLSTLKIMDSSGNEIDHLKNEFIMPDSDVYVEVVFDKEENPNTFDIVGYFMPIILGVSVILIVINNRKAKILK